MLVEHVRAMLHGLLPGTVWDEVLSHVVESVGKMYLRS